MLLVLFSGLQMQAEDALHITHQYANRDARSMIGLPLGSHKTIVTKDGQLQWSQWSLKQKGRAVTFGFSEQLDGALGLRLREVSGGRNTDLVAGEQRLDAMRYPFVLTEWKGGSLQVEETAFAALQGEQGLDVVQLTVTNASEAQRTLELRLDGKQRNLPAFVSGAHLATRDGQLLATVLPQSGVEVRPSEAEGLMLVERRVVPAHGSITFWVVLPYDYPEASVDRLATLNGSTLLRQVRADWDALWSQGAQLELPVREKELADFYQASVAYILMLTERDENGELWTLDGPAFYREFWGRGEYFQARSIEFAGYLPTALKTIRHTFSLQKSDGEWDGPVTSGWPAWDNIGGNAASVWDYYLLTRDTTWLAQGYPHLVAAARWIDLHRQETMLPADAPAASQGIQRQIPWKCVSEISPTLKPGEKPYWWGLLPWSYGDSGLPEGHAYPHNTWSLYAIKIAEQAAHVLGHADDEKQFAAMYASYKQDYMDSMRRSIELETEDKPYLPALPTEPDAGVSQSLIAVYPTDLLSANDPWVTNLLKRMRRDELEGLPTHMAWMGPSGVWPSESLNVAETYLRRGELTKMESLLMATLNHTYSTDAFKEEIKVDKSRLVACASGVSKEVEDGNGTGDMPEGWGPANLILLVRDMLLYEDHDTLHLLAGLPAHWIAPGEHLALTDAPTTLGGKVSLRLEYPEAGHMRLHLEPTTTVHEATVRFPLPDGMQLRSVKRNGQSITNGTGNTVMLKNLTGPVDLDVQF
ncbi:hypothetical protein ACOBR2_04030 [Telmatobacter bradus]|uniref:hypothetical protein n=1 Tax=Telmatobacter bradus TaxID=474953 RepID=UPI003B42A621